MPTHSLLLRGALVADGIADTTRRADILIIGDRIAEVRDQPGEGAPLAASPDPRAAPAAGTRPGPARDVRATPAGGAPPAAPDDRRAAPVEGAPAPAALSHDHFERVADPGRDQSVEVIDLPPGSVVCPGFIDAHAHAEGPLLEHGRVDGALAQGVTTLVVGQDGQSWIGATAATLTYLNRYFGPVNGQLAEPLDVAGYAAAVSGRLGQNVAVLASQGTIRHNVAGLAAGPLDTGQRMAARNQLARALAHGVAGLSSGLDYLPSRYGDPAEVAFTAAPLAAAGRPYVSHLRGYGPNVAAGLAELTEVGRRSGARVHASHLWGDPSAITPAFAAADAAGVTLTFDAYPYRRSSTLLTMLLLPPQIQARGPDRTVAALRDPAQRAALLAGDRFTPAYLAHVYLATLPAADAHLAGLPITEAAAQTGQPPGEWTLDLLARSALQVGANLDRPALTDPDLAWLARHPRHSAGSDAIYQGQHPHPRAYGAFARLATYYLDPSLPADPGLPADHTSPTAISDPNRPTSPSRPDRGRGYQTMVRHLATNAADVFGLRDRGRIAPGMAADLCVITPPGLTEHATYDAPATFATGVTLVLVNGVVTWRGDAPVAGSAAGRLVS